MAPAGVTDARAVTVSIGHVDDVGRFNILGERVTPRGTIRCLDESDRGTVQGNLRRLAEHHAAPQVPPVPSGAAPGAGRYHDDVTS
jgi:hypothetical protein